MPYMQNGKNIQIRTTNKNQGFLFHVEKSQLKMGSTISKKTHPVEQV